MSDLRLDLRVSLGRISDALHRYVDVMVGARDDTVPADVGTVRIESRSLSDRAALDGVVATARAHGCDLLILTHTATAIVWPPACDISVLVLRPGTDPEWVRARLAQIGEDAGERRSADEMGRMSIVAIADRAAADVGGHIIVGLDAKDGKVATDGWSKLTGHEVVDLARKFEDWGVESIVYTDIGRDGMLSGINIDATVKLAQALTIPVIASGGLGSMRDIEQLCAVESEGIEGVICGRAIYSGDLDFAAAQERADALNG